MTTPDASRRLVIALAGNPNSGKTTLFNALTGSRQHVGNYPGITVEKKEGLARHGDREMTVVDLPTHTPDGELEENSGRMTSSEAQAYKILSKKSEEALAMLRQHGFFRQESVLAALGKPEIFLQWLSGQPCCFPGNAPCDRTPIVAWQPAGARKWQGLAVCAHHAEQLEAGTASLPDGSPVTSWITTQMVETTMRWGQYALAQTLKVPSGRLPTPGAILSWADAQGLKGAIPSSFLRFLG